MNVSARLRELGLSERQIKKVHNNLRYRGMLFKRITAVECRYVNQYGMFVIDFIDHNTGEICEIDEDFL